MRHRHQPVLATRFNMGMSDSALREIVEDIRKASGIVFTVHTNSEVATILSVRLRTVKKHMERIFQKLGVESRTAAAVRVWESDGLKDSSDQSLGEEHFISCARCRTHVHTKACA